MSSGRLPRLSIVSRRPRSLVERAAALAAVSALWLWCACAFVQVPDMSRVTPDVPDLDSLPEEWRRYGAYYVIDEAVLVALSSSSFTTEHYTYRYTEHKRLRVTRSFGATHATIPVSDMGRLRALRVTITDQYRTTRDMTTPRMLSDAASQGKVVVPQMRAGAECDVVLEYEMKHPPFSHEHSFVDDLPVQLSVFTVDLTDNCTYEYHVYGQRAIEGADRGKLTRRTWRVRGLTPPRFESYSVPSAQSVPRVVVSLRSMSGANQSLHTWKSAAQLYNTQVQSIRSTNGYEMLVRNMRVLVRDEPDLLRRADLVCAWVQDNLAVGGGDYGESIQEAVTSGKASFLQAAVICRTMLAEAGLPARLLLTRPALFGGFDSSFVTLGSLMMPLVQTRINERDIAITPYDVAYPAGEYPSGYLGQKALDLDAGKVVDIPAPLSTVNSVVRRVLVNVSSDTATQHLRLTYYGAAACEQRSTLRSEAAGGLDEPLRDVLSAMGESNEFIGGTVQGLHDTREALVLSIAFRNPSAFVTIGGRRVCRLAPFIGDCLRGVDRVREGDMLVRNAVTLLDEVELTGGDSVSVDARLPAISNAMFTTTCVYNRQFGSHLLKRDTAIRAGYYTIARVRALMPDIERMRTFAMSTVMAR